MIKAELKKQGNELILIVKGHAGYGEYGKDIVCAAVSALVSTLACHLANKKTAALLRFEEGCGEIRSSNKEDYDFFFFVFEGIKRISELYPKNVSVLIE